MVESDVDGVLFPVVFFDGEREVNIGNVNIHSSLRFKNFQSILSQKIGISPNQISIYLVDRKKSKSAPGDRRRIPVTGKANFSLIAREKDCLILVVLKRSRRDRRRKPRQSAVELGDYLLKNNKCSPAPEKMLLLRRNPYVVSPFYNPIEASQFVDYSDAIRSLQIQRQNALMRNFFVKESFVGSNESESESESNRMPCEQCSSAEKEGRPATSFHWCVNDAVTKGFRSPAGPIARPNKSSQ